MTEVAGVHLLQRVDALDGPLRSAVARLDGDGTLLALDLARGDEEILSLLEGVARLTVDAPLVAPRRTGRRDAEAVLAWCDVPAFPVARDRLVAVTGGMRGVDLAAALAAGRAVAEALPDQVLRQIAWERAHPPDAPPLDLADYRAAWPAVRAPAYRPRGAGRGRASGLLPAWDLLAGVLDLGGWAPDPADAAAVADDAARLDALCCGYAALRAEAGTAVMLGTPAAGLLAVPADANLRARIELTLWRLRSEGTIAI
ncbi:MAG: hypothetical protein AB7V42_04070 [Thermoleophilia bacterium]